MSPGKIRVITTTRGNRCWSADDIMDPEIDEDGNLRIRRLSDGLPLVIIAAGEWHAVEFEYAKDEDAAETV